MAGKSEILRFIGAKGQKGVNKVTFGWGKVEKGRKRAGKGEILRCIGDKGRKRANKVSM